MAEIAKVGGVDSSTDAWHYPPTARTTDQPGGQAIVIWGKPQFIERRTQAEKRHNEHDKSLFDTRQFRDRRKSIKVDYDV